MSQFSQKKNEKKKKIKNTWKTKRLKTQKKKQTIFCEMTDMCVLYDNSGLYQVLSNNLGSKVQPLDFGHINCLLAKIESSMTSGMRYGNLNSIATTANNDMKTQDSSKIRFTTGLGSNLRTFAQSLIPFDQMKYVYASLSPIVNAATSNETSDGSSRIAADAINFRNFSM